MLQNANPQRFAKPSWAQKHRIARSMNLQQFDEMRSINIKTLIAPQCIKMCQRVRDIDHDFSSLKRQK
jgi:hypothetical protein